jgi:hypothetical protein
VAPTPCAYGPPFRPSAKTVSVSTEPFECAVAKLLATLYLVIERRKSAEALLEPGDGVDDDRRAVAQNPYGIGRPVPAERHSGLRADAARPTLAAWLA